MVLLCYTIIAIMNIGCSWKKRDKHVKKRVDFVEFHLMNCFETKIYHDIQSTRHVKDVIYVSQVSKPLTYSLVV